MHSDTIRAAFARWEAYRAFEAREVSEQNAPAGTIRVEFGKPRDYYKFASSSTIGLAFCQCFGHEENRVVISSVHVWTEDDLLLVLMHEIAHIVLSMHNHPARPSSVLYSFLSNRPARLDWEDLRELRNIYGSVKPIPQQLVAPYKP